MQFLESAATALNKVDRLAADVIPKRLPAADDGEDLLETGGPDAVPDADAVEALGAKLRLSRSNDRDDRGGDDDDAAEEMRAKLASLVADLRASEAETRRCVARRDEARAEADRAREARRREDAHAAEALAALEREIAAEKAALEHAAAQAEERERALRGSEEEVLAYARSLESLAASRDAEAARLEAAAAAARADQSRLRAEAAEAVEAAEAAEARANDEEKSAEEKEKSAEASALATLRAEVDAAEAEAAEARGEEARSRAAASSAGGANDAAAASRCAELERRLESLAVELEAKRRKAANIAAEKTALEATLADALATRNRLRGEDIVRGGDPGGGRGGGAGGGVLGLKRRGVGVGSTASARDDDEGAGGSVTGLRVRSRVARAARRVDTMSVRAGQHLRRSGGWRSAVMLYVLGLHTTAFVVLAYRALGGGPKP